MVAASLAQQSDFARAVYPSLTGLPVLVPVAAGLIVGAAAGIVNGTPDRDHRHPALHRHARHDGHRTRHRQMVHARPAGQHAVASRYAAIGSGVWPVVIFLVVALIFHIALRYTRYGKFTYAIGANVQAARVSGINVGAHLMKVYAIAGLLAGLAGIVTSARAISGQAGMGVMYELDAIAATVIGGTSLSGGVGRITGTVIGTIILGVMTSGFTFLRVDAYYQEIVKGIIIVAAVVVDQYRQRKRRKV